MKSAAYLHHGTGCILLMVFWSAWLGCASVNAHEAAGGNVRIVSTIDTGGSVQTAGNLQVAGFVGEPGVVATGGGVVARQGGNSMIYYAAGFSVESAAATINESGVPDAESTRTPLSGAVVYDDNTLGVVDRSSVVWSAPLPDSALTSISAEGVAQAATVYTNTVASFTGFYGGMSASNRLTVLNVLPDNFRQWAGDTFDDAWEISQGMDGAVDPNATNNGVPNWQLYAMGLNPAQPAPAALASTVLTNGYLAVRYTRNPSAAGYTFTPQESGNLSAGFANLVNSVSVTNFVNGVEQIATRGSVPINATNRQFLRVKVSRPTSENRN